MTVPPSFELIWDERFLDYDFGPGHPFTEVSRGLAIELLEAWADGRDLPIVRVREVPVSSREELRAFHAPEYLDRVAMAAMDPRCLPLDQGDTPAFPGCDVAAGRLVGGTLRAVASATTDGPRVAFQPGGGLHHAHPGRASGFCIFNDVAVAIARWRAGRPGTPVAYIDIDVHHGDGVMYGFFDDGKVLDVDFHQDGRTIFPGTGAPEEIGRGDGAGTKVNLVFPPGAGDREFLDAFDAVVPVLVREHRPGLILLQCGTDAHAGDSLGQLRYSVRAYLHAVGSLRALAEELGAGFVVTGGGGYSASNVSLTLASVGRCLAGGAAVSDDEPLPDGWRAEFAAVTGTPAPTHWESGRPLPNATRPLSRAVRDVEGPLGRRFRRADPVTR